MRKAIAIILTLACVAGCGPETVPIGFSWEARKPGAKALYLVPTLHSSSKNLTRLPVAIENAILASDIVAAEFNGALDAIEGEFGCRRKHTPPPDKPLTPASARLLRETFGISDVGSILEARTALARAADAKLSLLPSNSIDLAIRRAVRNHAKTLVPIEDGCVVVELLAEAAKQFDEVSVIAFANALQRGDHTSSWRRVEAAWIAGDHSTACTEVLSAAEVSPADFSAFGIVVERRNNLMADRLDKLSRENSIVAVAGLSHFCGDRSLLSYLKGIGYEVKPRRH